MSDKLHQINVSYSEKEDRLLLRTTTHAGAEYRIWLTRRFTLLLFDILKEQMDKQGGFDTVAASSKTREMFREGALEKKFETDNINQYPLGEEGILGFAVKSGTSGEGDVLHLEILPQKGHGITMNLDKSMLYMLHNVLMQGVNRAGWQLGDQAVSAADKVH